MQLSIFQTHCLFHLFEVWIAWAIATSNKGLIVNNRDIFIMFSAVHQLRGCTNPSQSRPHHAKHEPRPRHCTPTTPAVIPSSPSPRVTSYLWWGSPGTDGSTGKTPELRGRHHIVICLNEFDLRSETKTSTQNNNKLKETKKCVAWRWRAVCRPIALWSILYHYD